MKLYQLEGGKNVIDLDDYGRLVFSDLTATSQGYRWLTYNKEYIEILQVKQGDGSRREVKIDQRESHVFNFKMKRDAAGKLGVPRGTIPVKLVNWLVSTFDELTDGEVFPYKNIENLKSKIEKTNFEKMLKKQKKDAR